MKKILPNWIIWSTEHLPQYMLQILVVFYLEISLKKYIHGFSSTKVKKNRQT